MADTEGLIILRQSPDWGNLDYDHFSGLSDFEKMVRLPIGFVESVIRTWDKTFPVSYFQVRQRMKDITLANMAQVSRANLVTLQEAKNDLPKADVYLFTDDDDWFAPDIITSIKAIDGIEKLQGIAWRTARFGGDIRVKDQVYCFTNNYAVTAAFFEQHGAGAIGNVDQHGKANHVFFNTGIPNHFLQTPLSIANKHPCSPSTLNNNGVKVRGKSLREFTRGFFDAIDPDGLPDEFTWANPVISQIRDLYAEVLEV